MIENPRVGSSILSPATTSFIARRLDSVSYSAHTYL